MSTTDYLKGLDLDQLRFARDCANELIKAKEEEDFVPIWVVANDCVNVAAFAIPEFQKAVERAHRLVDEESELGTSFMVRVDKERRRESELADMLALSV